jgi:hypothetical protein
LTNELTDKFTPRANYSSACVLTLLGNALSKADSEATRLAAAGYGISAAILFVAFVITTFPYTDTLSAMLEPMNRSVVCQHQQMRILPTWLLDESVSTVFY